MADNGSAAVLRASVKHPRTVVLVVAARSEQYIRLPAKAPAAYYETHATGAQLREAVAYHGGAVAAIAITPRLGTRLSGMAAGTARQHGVPLVRL